MAFPEQNPHQHTIPIFQSVPFPPTILPQHMTQVQSKMKAVCPNLSIVCFKKTTQDSSFGSKFGRQREFIGCRREETVFWRLNPTSLTKHDF
jgi:hypothetical protein